MDAAALAKDAARRGRATTRAIPNIFEVNGSKEAVVVVVKREDEGGAQWSS